MSVPGVARAVNLMASTLGSLPVERVKTDPEGLRRAHPPNRFWDCPAVDTPRFITMTETAKDLILDGVSYWMVQEKDAEGFPSRIAHAPLHELSWTTDNFGQVTSMMWREREYSMDWVVAFQGWHTGIRNFAASIIRTAMSLELAARRYAEVPLPSMILKNTSTYELSGEEIAALISGMKRARADSAIGYLNGGVDLDTLGWDARELQLVEARVMTNAQIANAVGIPAHFIAASNPGGSSLTYANVSQEARLLSDYSMRPLVTAMEARLSMNDVMPRGWSIRFQMDSMLRGNAYERAQLYALLLDHGVMTVDEAREWEDLAPAGPVGTPATTPTPAPSEATP